jgi:cyclic pyranopterin phosphate synthase
MSLMTEPQRTRAPLVDKFGRVVHKLRISLTDRCNFRCVYCMPEDATFLNTADLLTADEIVRLAGLFAEMGTGTIRLTGGEPLMRPDVVAITRRITALPGVRRVSMTTNGFLLPRYAADLVAAGLHDVNVSLDTLDPVRFKVLARRSHLDEVLAGIAAAEAAGLAPVKINTVVMRGVNGGEIADFLHWARETGHVVRFIEFMPLDADNIWQKESVVTLKEILDVARAIGPVEEVSEDKASPARLFRFRDGRGTFGVIASVSEPFCRHCDRVRLTAEGRIRNCLFATDETDLRALLRSGADDAALEQRIRDSVAEKWAGHLIAQPGFVKPERTMHRIGG